jgi:uncharacterized protein
MIEILWWGAVLRFFQALLQAMPTILVGVLVAGVFRRLVGYQGIRRLFGQGTWRALPQAWLIGMLLPVCSLGVIPVARQLRKAGLSGGTILAFALTAPLFNPISVLYGLTLSNPVVIVTFCFCSLVIVTVVGLTWDWLFPGTAVQDTEPPAAAYGIKRMLAVALTAADELTSPAAWYVVVGMIGVASLSVVLPFGYLQRAAEHHDPWAPAFMALVAIPAYATPMTAMVQLASMFEHGNSVGAAFALLALGAGANLGLIAWMTHSYGIRRTAVWFGILWAVVVGLAYGVDKPLYPRGVDPAGHTHAFDGYCCPFQAGEDQVLRKSLALLAKKTAPYERQALIVLVALALFGLVLKRTGWIESWETWMQQQPAAAPRYDIVLPGPVLGGVALAGLIGLSVLGCYVYYPPPGDILEELRIVNTEVVSSAGSQDWDTTAYWIPIQRDWTRKLQVSLYLRGHDLTRYQRAKAAALLERLELLEHEIEESRTGAGAVEELGQSPRDDSNYQFCDGGGSEPVQDSHRLDVRVQARAVHQAYRRLRAAYADFANE